MEINELLKESYECAKEKGWHDPPRSFGEDISLMHSELSEALEEYRNGHSVTEVYYDKAGGAPLGIPVELADVLIRIFDVCKRHNIDLQTAIELKQAYNRTRSFRHGGKSL